MNAGASSSASTSLSQEQLNAEVLKKIKLEKQTQDCKRKPPAPPSELPKIANMKTAKEEPMVEATEVAPQKFSCDTNQYEEREQAYYRQVKCQADEGHRTGMLNKCATVMAAYELGNYQEVERLISVCLG